MEDSQREPTVEKRVQKSIGLYPSMWGHIDRISKLEKRSLAFVVEELVSEALQERAKKNSQAKGRSRRAGVAEREDS